MLVCVFQASDAYYALEAEQVIEVNRYEAPTKVHHAPPELLGLMNLRGRILTMLDVSVILGGAKVVPGPECRMLVLEQGGENYALLVERVEGVFEIEATDGVVTDFVAHGDGNVLVRGVLRINQLLVSLLDGNLLLKGSPLATA